MIKVVIAGFLGRMGSAAVSMVKETEDFLLVGLFDPKATMKEQEGVPVFTEKGTMVEESLPDVWIDFTVPEVAYENTLFAIEQGIAPVVGTTGFKEEELHFLSKRCKELQQGALIAPNFAIGAILMMEFAQRAAKFFPDVEIIELHHDQKLDAPSGTAIKTAEKIREAREKKIQGHPSEKETIPGARGADVDGMRIHSVRLPGLIAHQVVQFGGEGEGLTIRHDSYTRESFMSGVRLAVEKIGDYKELVHGLERLL